MYSDGRRFRCGTSWRSLANCRSIRQACAGAQAKPASTSTTFSVGKALEHALEDQAGQHRLLALRVPDHLLDVVGRPAAGGQRAAAIAEGMDADRQVGFGRRLIDRPVAPLAERFGGAGQQQHLGEVRIAGALRRSSSPTSGRPRTAPPPTPSAAHRATSIRRPATRWWHASAPPTDPRPARPGRWSAD